MNSFWIYLLDDSSSRTTTIVSCFVLEHFTRTKPTGPVDFGEATCRPLPSRNPLAAQAQEFPNDGFWEKIRTNIQTK